MKLVKTLGAVTVCCLLALWLIGASKSATTLPPESAGEAAAPQTHEHSVQWQRSVQEDAILVAERIQHLEKVDKQRSLLEAAAAQMIDYRSQVQSEATPRWKQFVTENREAYRQLLAKAMNSPSGEADCTLCDGKSYTPCVMCKSHDGQCVTCRGSGRLNHEAICPTCVGHGKCYLCTGSGKMFCPFCNDGVIEARGRPPSYAPPLE